MLLKLCPFCGGKAETKIKKVKGNRYSKVKCTVCHASGPELVNKTAAERMWNKRGL